MPDRTWIEKLTDKDMDVLHAIHNLVSNARHRRIIEVHVTPKEVTVSLVSREQQHMAPRESLY